MVFGTSHSGTLILNNLKQLGCQNVYAVYRGKTPAQQELKLAAAVIAQEIQTKQWGDLTPTFINYDDFSKIYRILSKANAVIYAIGFEPRTFTYTNRDGICSPLTNDTPGIYGFGIGRPRPTMSTDGIGFEGFIKAIQAELPGILSA